ncbi:MAG: serine/threonine-protein phosphatase [Deltaproteobacteria bacterium]|nr:serine/threonine-protein phosphatase [Deltaproteobacteria bacterium]MBW2659250.1 serine/threonine-protein phosphatase [Deltaproteobacteria bacterium]
MNTIRKTTAWCSTDPGLIRSNNEDTCLINDKDGYYLVADGMGGAAAGEKASALFRETVDRKLSKELIPAARSIQELVRDCFHSANRKILSSAAEIPSDSGMGCTAELLVIHGSRFILGHVGDSRTYRMRDGRLQLLTTDHTIVQEQLTRNLISPQQAKKHPMRNLITRVVGSRKELKVDMVDGSILPGDLFLLCTDGLTDMVEETELPDTLSLNAPLEVRSSILIDQAKEGGGKDNITVALIEIEC